jgi:hypothetical protein
MSERPGQAEIEHVLHFVLRRLAANVGAADFLDGALRQD